MAKADTVKVYLLQHAPLSLKIQIKPIKGLIFDIINKVAEIKGWNIKCILALIRGCKCGAVGSSRCYYGGYNKKAKEREDVFAHV